MPLPRYRLYTQLRNYAAIGRDVLLGRRNSGDDCARLEEAIRGWGAPHAVCTPQARLAIYLAVQAIVEPGRKVVLSPKKTRLIVPVSPLRCLATISSATRSSSASTYSSRL